MELKVEAVNLRDLLETLAAMMRPLADRGGVELIVELPGDLPVMETDGKKLQQVVFNLLSNAVKFTSDKWSAAGAGSGNGAWTGGGGQAGGMGGAGSAKVTLRAERLPGRATEGPGAADRVRICVLDTGPGIAPEDRQRIFEKFQQADSGHTRRHAGTGLGLAICKELTGILQGEIQLDSEVGRGSMFSVILPEKIDAGRAEEMGWRWPSAGSWRSGRTSRCEGGRRQQSSRSAKQQMRKRRRCGEARTRRSTPRPGVLPTLRPVVVAWVICIDCGPLDI